MRVETEHERIVPVNLHWLEGDHEWMECDYAGIIDELCEVITENVDEFEKRVKNETKVVFKRVAGHSKVSMAVAVKPIESSNHSVFVIGDVHALYQNASYCLTVWIGPKTRTISEDDMHWPIECVL